MNIVVSYEPIAAHADALLNGLSNFNRRYVPDLERVSEAATFYAIATNEDDKFVGGISARCFWNTLHIDLLWIDDRVRSKGLGGKLLRACEEHGVQEGCEIASVETMSWQAKPFYQRHGYTLLGTIDDRPKGEATHYLTKRLNP